MLTSRGIYVLAAFVKVFRCQSSVMHRYMMGWMHNYKALLCVSFICAFDSHYFHHTASKLSLHIYSLRRVIFMTAKIHIVFWTMTLLYRFAVGYQCFGITYCIRPQGRLLLDEGCSNVPKRWYTGTRLHGHIAYGSVSLYSLIIDKWPYRMNCSEQNWLISFR
jgi:hypothetical protein